MIIPVPSPSEIEEAYHQDYFRDVYFDEDSLPTTPIAPPIAEDYFDIDQLPINEILTTLRETPFQPPNIFSTPTSPSSSNVPPSSALARDIPSSAPPPAINPTDPSIIDINFMLSLIHI